jgi:hypothetical protein
MEAKNPKYSQADNSTIDIEINHAVYGWIPFTADPKDVEAHGRELFAQAVAGEFGEIAPYVPPTVEVLAQIARADRDAKLAIEIDPLVSNPLRWGELSQADKDLIAAYRQALLDVPEQIGFPTEIVWPVYPL